jgi:hypothetical protein
MGLVARSA